MRWSACLLALMIVPALAAPAQAVWPFTKKKQGNPADRVSELVATIKNGKVVERLVLPDSVGR